MMLAIVEHAGLFGFPISLVHHTPFGFMETELRLGAHDVRPCPAMREARMHRIHAVLDALEPITILEALDRDINFALADEKIVARHQRRRLRSEISEDQSAQFFYLIGRQANIFFLERTVGGLAGDLHNFAARVVEPTMITAAHAVAFDIAETQVGPSVRTKSADHAHLAAGVPEKNQIFAEHADECRLRLQMRRDADGPPVTTQDLPLRRPPPRARQNFIFFFVVLYIDTPSGSNRKKFAFRGLFPRATAGRPYI